MSGRAQYYHGSLYGGVNMEQTYSKESYGSQQSIYSAETQSTSTSSQTGSTSPYPASPGSADQNTYSQVYQRQGYEHDYFTPQETQVNNVYPQSHPNDTMAMGGWLQQPAYHLVDPVQRSLSGLQLQSSPMVAEREERWTPSMLGWVNDDRRMSKYYDFRPREGEEHHWELRENVQERKGLPHTVYLDPQDQAPSDPKPYKCKYPTSDSTCKDAGDIPKGFARAADLTRHYNHIHTPSKYQDKHICPYITCNRKQDHPFTRKDHLRDHLREVHMEDIGLPKKSKGEKDWPGKVRRWWRSRSVNTKHWRCVKCLENKLVSKGWECEGCGVTCEQDRIALRDALKRKEQSLPTTKSFKCRTCSDTGLVANEGWKSSCPTCALSTQETFGEFEAAMLDDVMYDQDDRR